MGLSSTLAREGASKNIRVNVIAPLAASRMTETVMPPEMLAALKPEFVTPVVLYLAHESCEETGGIFEIGGGWVAKLRWNRAKGGVLPPNDVSPEAVAKIWNKITDFSADSEFPSATTDSFPPVMAAIETHAKAKL